MQTKWCPAPDCTCAVEFLGDENYDVLCNCKFSFCWNVCWFHSPNDLAFFFMGPSDQVCKASSISITVCSAPRKLIDQWIVRLYLSGYWRTAQNLKIWTGLSQTQYCSTLCNFQVLFSISMSPCFSSDRTGLPWLCFEQCNLLWSSSTPWLFVL